MATTISPHSFMITKPKKNDVLLDIPLDRAVIGSDISALQEAKGQALMDSTWESGWYNSRHNETVTEHTFIPLTSIPRALLIRSLAHGLNCKIPVIFPEELVSYGLVPTPPKFREFHLLLSSAVQSAEEKKLLPFELDFDLKPQHTATLIGFNGSSGTRWMTEVGKEPNPAALRLCLYVYSDIRRRGSQALIDFLYHVHVEAINRNISGGIIELLDSEKWTTSLGSGKRGRGRPSRAQSIEQWG